MHFFLAFDSRVRMRNTVYLVILSKIHTKTKRCLTSDIFGFTINTQFDANDEFTHQNPINSTIVLLLL